jgi:hypothetical protein
MNSPIDQIGETKFIEFVEHLCRSPTALSNVLRGSVVDICRCMSDLAAKTSGLIKESLAGSVTCVSL